MQTQAQTNNTTPTPLENLAHPTHTLSHYSQPSFAQDNTFLGRARELATIEQCFQDPGCRLLTLTGFGGVGKTRIAWEAGTRIAHYFAQSSYFISLAPIATPTLIVPTLASSLGYLFQGAETPLAQLIDFLRNREMLLVLDNFEHLLSGADLIAEILRAAPNLHLLITSRERLNLQQEWVLEIHGLDYPPEETGDSLDRYSAIQFFLQCARRAKADFQLTTANQADVIRICRLVEGMPLAIELAASWVRSLSYRAIGDEIERNLDFLTTRLSDVPEKHQSMRAVFAHTVELLTVEQREGFSKLTVFRGGFQREAAEAVAGAALLTLAALLDKSLVRLAADGRYDIHELLRHYGTEQLEAAGEGDSTRDTHSAYYADFIHRRLEDLKGRRQLEAMAEINADFENVRTAWNWAAAHSREDTVEPMIEGLWVFGVIRNRDVEVMALLRDAEPQFAPEYGNEPRRIWGRLLTRAAAGEAFQMQIDSALQIARRHDDLAEIAFCLERLAVSAYAKREFTKVKQLLEQSLTYYRRLGDRYFIASVLFDLQSYDYEGAWEDIKRYGEEGFRLRREIGDRVGAAWSLSALAIDHAREGRFAESERLWLERIALGYEIGNLDLVALGNAHISHWVYFFQGDFVKARAAAKEAFQIATTLGDSNTAGWALATLGLLASMEEHYLEAKTVCKQAASAQGLAWIADLAAFGSSIAACGLADYDAASDSIAPTLKSFINLFGLVGTISCLPVAAILLAHQGNPVRAAELLALAFTHPVGAAGWMEKWSLLAHLRAALEQTLGLEAYSAAWERGTLLDVEAVVADLLVQFRATPRPSRESSNTSLEAPLTKRELEILGLVMEGLSNRDIAARLFLSPTTIKWYLSEIYGKLGASGRMEAVACARALNILA